MPALLPDPAPYAPIAELLRSRTGLVFGSNRRPEFEAGIGRAMARAAIADPEGYLRLLEDDAAALDDLAEELTVGETYFFRDLGQFRFIREIVLPELRRGRAPDHVFRAWSAGCATGEEAYSLAMSFEEEGLADRVQIRATDISRRALAKAREGRYSSRSLRGEEGALALRYVRETTSGFVVADRLRRAVAFGYLNLALDSYPAFAAGIWGMDLILCRNVLIYLDRRTIRDIARRMFDALAIGGWLLTGPSDPPLSEDSAFETVITPAGLAYRRSAAARPSRMDAGHAAPTAQRKPVPGPLGRASPPRRPPLARARGREPRRDPLDQARAAYAGGDYRRVVELTRGREANVAAASLRIRALAAMGEAESAERLVAEAAAGAPLEPELQFLRAVLLMELGRYDEAAHAVRRVLYLEPALAVGQFTLASVLQRLGNTDAALRCYRNAYRLAAARPADEAVPLADGESAGRLAEAAQAQIALLGGGGGA